MQDLRYALRALRRNPGFSLTAILALALGIGVNAAMFSVVDGVLLKPLPFPDADRLVGVKEQWLKRGFQGAALPIPLPPGDFWDYHRENQFFEKFAGYRFNAFSLTMPDAEPERYFGALITEDYLDALRIKPILGRSFRAEDMEPGKSDVVIISHKLWANWFGGKPDILGSRIFLDGTPREVIGIMPPKFDYPDETEIWSPLVMVGNDKTRRDMHNINTVARLKPGATVSQAQSQLQSILSRIGAEASDMAKDKGVIVTPMMDDMTGKVRPALWALVGAVGFVLAIACANVANLLLARGAARQQELAVRTALGAERGRLVRQLLTESLLLSAIGGIAGLILSLALFWALKLLAPQNLPRLNDIALDGRTILFTVAATFATGILFGMLPAIRLSRVDVNGSLKERARGSSVRSRLRGLLVVSQVAAALILLAGAGLLIRSFYQLSKVDLGFNPDNLITMRVTPLPAKYTNAPEKNIQLGRDILAQVKQVQGVQNAGLTTNLPLLGNPRFIMRFEGFPPVTVANAPLADFFTVSPGYFETMGVRLQRGRFFTEQDNRQSPLVCIVNEALVRAYFPNQDPIGRRLEIGFSNPPHWREIVGVIADVKNVDLDQPSPVQVYGAFWQRPSIIPGVPPIGIVARTAGDPAALANPVRQAVMAADNSQPVFNIKTMNTVVSEKVSQRRFSLLLMCLFASVALALAVIGLAGVISYVVSQRTQEIGIRMALGAQRRDVVWMVQSQALKLVGAGVILGIAGALLLSRFLSTMLYGVEPHDPTTFLLVALVLTAAALAAAYLPARRATKVDPVNALRQE